MNFNVTVSGRTWHMFKNISFKM
uniref:Uncharacterized protein n=1 Tax=Anguilla anguilla TaxID=7936 RepID=A0A0E9T3D8_ANGAN